MSDAHAHEQPGLAHHFDSYEQQRESATLGMWAFLVNEVMFFGGMFLAYYIYRSRFPLAFAAGSHELDIGLGAFNTAVLIGSSLTMALAVRAAQLGQSKKIQLFLVLTMLLGGIFLGVKVVEYSAKFEHHLVPGAHFQWPPHHEGAVSASEQALLKKFEGVPSGPAQIFFSLYFAMTGFHALHMIVGIGIMFFMLKAARDGKYTPQNHNFVEGFGLYWHFVDIVWIFLFPLLYLLGRH